MSRKAAISTVFSKVSVKSQTVLPKAVRERLGLVPGDRVRYRLTDDGVAIDKALASEGDDPFAEFTEWASTADDAAYADL